MKTNLVIILALFLGGCAGNPADKAPQAGVGNPGATSSSAPVAGTRYALDPTSKVEFVGSKVSRSHVGGFKTVTGEIGLVDKDPQKSSVKVDIDMGSLYVDDAKLKIHLKSQEFFDIEKFPKSTFQSRKVAKKGDDFEITGELTLHGVTKAISFPAKIEVADDRIAVTSEFTVNRMDFGIKYPGMADDLIRNEVVLKLNVAATRPK